MSESGPFLLAPLIWPLGHVTTALKKDPNEPPRKVFCKNFKKLFFLNVYQIFQLYLECLPNIPTLSRMSNKDSNYILNVYQILQHYLKCLTKLPTISRMSNNYSNYI